MRDVVRLRHPEDEALEAAVRHVQQVEQDPYGTAIALSEQEALMKGAAAIIKALCWRLIETGDHHGTPLVVTVPKADWMDPAPGYDLTTGRSPDGDLTLTLTPTTGAA